MPKAADSRNPPKPRANRKAANAYKFPDKLPKGEVLKDVAKREWILGDSIGRGGFGEIYCAAEANNPSKLSYVIKIEPHENGPLFMEKNFYIKVGKSEDIETWKREEGIKILGMPTFYGSGTHYCKDVKYRFLVMERYGQDLWSQFLAAKTFPPQTVYRCALQILDALRYIHDKGYVHGDIKGANLLLGLKSGTENQVFLVDFGLACKYSQKPFQKDPKQAHNGTIEYTSCDWHLGIPTRRGDLEILGYNLLHWLCGSLPWEKDISNKETVHKKKQELIANVEGYFKKHFPNVTKVLTMYMSYVSKLKYDEEPNYKYCKELFAKELKQIGSSLAGALEFKAVKISQTPTTPRRTSVRNKSKARDQQEDEKDEESEDEENEVPIKKVRAARKPRVTKKKEDQVILSDDGSDSENELTNKSKSKTARGTASEAAPKRAARTAAKTRKKPKAEPAKPSWRDAPTVQGNLGNRAGEYVRRNKP